MYPWVGLCGATALVALLRGATTIVPRLRRYQSVLLWACIGASALVSASRSAALFSNYHAPLDLYGSFQTIDVAEGETALVCVGKEWYRYPSSFFLPDTMRLGFLQSEYRGLLPKYYASANGTSVIPTEMNNRNREEPSRYVKLDDCDFVVDLDSSRATKLEPQYRRNPEFEEVGCLPFLEPSETPLLHRTLFVPALSARHARFSDYCILVRKSSLQAQKGARRPTLAVPKQK